MVMDLMILIIGQYLNRICVLTYRPIADDVTQRARDAIRHLGVPLKKN